LTAGASAAPLRSWLFVPGDSERKQARALTTRADALILDLEDSVDPAQLPAARQRVAALLRAGPPPGGAQLWVRVNPTGSAHFAEDLRALFAAAPPHGLAVPKVSAAAEIGALAAQLQELERPRGQQGRTRLLVIATETPQGLLALPQYPQALAGSAAASRLSGLTWGMEDLSTALGATGRREASGALTFTMQLARSTCLLAAAALGVQAVDSVVTDFRDQGALQAELAAARRDGFSGKLAIHPDQVAAINAAFAPSADELAHARRVLAAFAATPGAGVANLDGQMIDRPHLLQAQRLLAAAQREEPT
jgi:citrate lyase subunit beta / citryl-CoA lyase